MSRANRHDERGRVGGHRRVLMLAYYFPPLGGGGVQRTLKHVKYLPDEGFEPVVVTARGACQPLKDPSLDADVPSEAIVLRAPELPLYLVKWALEAMLRRVRLPGKLAEAIGWPDELVGWAPGALWSALRAVRRYKPDVIYSTSSPVSAHVVAMAVSRLTGLPWVADFRDAWTLNPQGTRILSRMSERLERQVVRHAGRIVLVDESIELLGASADDPRRVVIPNGVDPDDLPPLAPRRTVQKLRLAHVGMLYGTRDAAPVFEALQRLIARGDLDRDRFELRLVGAASPRSGVKYDSVPVSTRGYVDHRGALAEMAAADVLLLYHPPGQRGSSGKIYEYLATGRPVLCVAPSDGVAAGLVSELEAGICAAPDDQAAIEQALGRLYEAWSAGELGASERVRQEALRRFSRRTLAAQLARVLWDACSAGRPGLSSWSGATSS